MKDFVKWVFLTGLLLIFFKPLYSASPARYIKVEKFMGICEYKIGYGNWNVLKVGSIIPEDAEIRIKGENDSLHLRMPDNSLLILKGITNIKASDLLGKKIADNKKDIKRTSTRFVTVESFVGSCEARIDENWDVLKIGDQIPEYAEVRVNGRDDYLELSLPDGSGIKLLGLTSIKVGDILKKKEDGRISTFFSLLTGKIFTKVKQGALQDFRIETQTAIAAVRGTRFFMSYTPGEGGKIIVSEGVVALRDSTGSFNEVIIKKGEAAEIPAQVGEPVSSPKTVSPEEIKKYDKEFKEPKQETFEKPEISPVKEESGKEEPVPKGCSKEGINWSISAENIDNLVWNKVLISPSFRFGDFSFGLYLAFYFQNLEDLGHPDRWYNYEDWDFRSTDDSIHDILMKIRFIQYKNSFMLAALGGLPDVTIGHGILVDGYANDIEFPSNRRIGIQFNLDIGAFGFESMIGDVYALNPIGGRAYARPFNGIFVLENLAFGVSAFADFNPYLDWKQRVFGYGADTEYSIVREGPLKTALYADIATLGYQDDILSIQKSYVGYGAFCGIKGSLFVLDYKAEFRHVEDGFIPSYVDKYYEIEKEEKYSQLVSGLQPDFNGFLFGVGKTIEGIGGVSLSYEHLFPNESVPEIENTLHIEAGVDKCLFKKAYGRIAYDRKNFTFEELFNNFIGDGVMITTEAYYEISEGIYVGIYYKRYYEKDSSGNLTEKSTFGLQTQMGI